MRKPLKIKWQGKRLYLKEISLRRKKTKGVEDKKDYAVLLFVASEEALEDPKDSGFAILCWDLDVLPSLCVGGSYSINGTASCRIGNTYFSAGEIFEACGDVLDPIVGDGRMVSDELDGKAIDQNREKKQNCDDLPPGEMKTLERLYETLDYLPEAYICSDCERFAVCRSLEEKFPFLQIFHHSWCRKCLISLGAANEFFVPKDSDENLPF